MRIISIVIFLIFIVVVNGGPVSRDVQMRGRSVEVEASPTIKDRLLAFLHRSFRTTKCALVDPNHHQTTSKLKKKVGRL